jgi:LysR family transcriptional regulator (chromosome initiation inhibitor)
VVAEGGFERAGERLGLTQSAVSQRIRQLEELVGTILVVRDTPPRPSPAGERLLRHFVQTRELEAAAFSEAAMSSADGSAAGFRRLAVAVNADSLATWFLEATVGFWKSCPALFDIRVDDQDRTLRFLKSGEACACLSPRSGASSAAPPSGSDRWNIGSARPQPSQPAGFPTASPEAASRPGHPLQPGRRTPAASPVQLLRT